MKKQFLEKGLFEKPWMKSCIKSEQMSVKEKLLGYLVGPFGLLALQAIVNQLAELYYTEIFYIDDIFGVGTYLFMSWTSKVVSVIAGLAIAYIVENSKSSQGRIRPFVLIGSLISCVGAFFMFFIPDMPKGLMLAWVYLFNILYNGIGATLFALRTNMLTLCTREQKDRNFVNLLDRISSYMLVGVAITMTVGSVLYYTFLHGFAKENWILLIGIAAALAIPLSFINYFYTIERVTLDEKDVDGAIYKKNKMDVVKQLKCLFSSKYWRIAFAINCISFIAANLQGYNLNTNFCTIILGANAENNYNLFYTVVSGIPMGIGAIIVFPLAKKLTIRKTTMIFAIVSIIGSLIGLIAQDNFWLSIVGNFFFNMGTLPNIYILNALVYAANDDIEYRYDFRCEGTIALAITTSLSTIITGVFSGVYETGLSFYGYQPLMGVDQPSGVISWLNFVKFIVPIIQYAGYFVLLYFMDLETKLPEMQKEIEERHKKYETSKS